MSDDFLERLGVSRETMTDLDGFVGELLRWNKKINLVGRSTEASVFDRHIKDSIQLLPNLPIADSIADLGSGGGLPALVYAICLRELRPKTQIHLVESDQRKCAFLQTMTSKFNLNAKVHSQRIEVLAPLGVDILTARALAPLCKLLEYAERHMSKNGTAIFLKGENHKEEVLTASTSWSFDYKTLTSATNSDAALLEIKNIRRRND